MNTVASTVTTEKKLLEFLSVGIEDRFFVVIKVNFLALIAVICLIWLLVLLVKRFLKNGKRQTLSMEEMSFAVGNISCTFTCSREVRQIAYQLWVELVTRKLAVPVEESDVIVELYDSWYEAFRAIRGLLKTIPGECLDDAGKLIDLTIRVLNDGLRPHLTKWQARYRAWYDEESKNSSEAPQAIQKRFAEYDVLYSDLKKTNQDMIKFAEKMHEIAIIPDNPNACR